MTKQEIIEFLASHLANPVSGPCLPCMHATRVSARTHCTAGPDISEPTRKAHTRYWRRLIEWNWKGPTSPLQLFADLGEVSSFLESEIQRAPSSTTHLVGSLRLARKFLLCSFPEDASPTLVSAIRDRLPILLDLAYKRASKQQKTALRNRKRKRLQDGELDWTWARSVFLR